MALSRLLEWKVSSKSINVIAFSPDGNLIATGDCDSYIKFLTNTCAPSKTIKCNDVICSIAFCPSGDLVAAGLDNGSIEIWNIRDCVCLLMLTEHTNRVSGVSFSPNGRTLASGSLDSTVRIWDVATGNCVRVLSKCHSWMSPVSYSPNRNRIVTCSSSGTNRVWDIANSNCLFTHDSVYSYNYAHAIFSPDGRVIAVASSTNVFLLDANTGATIYTLQHDTSDYYLLAFVSNWHLLIASMKGCFPIYRKFIKLWDLHTRTCITILDEESNGYMQSIAVSPNSCVLASGSNSGTVTLWNISAFLPKAGVLTLVLGGRRCRLPHIPQELWQLILDEFY